MGQARAAAIDLYFLDESGFAPTLPPGYTWARMGTRAIVPYVAPQGRRVNVIGALAPHGPQPRLAYQSRTGKIDSVAFLEFLWRDVAGLPAAPDRLPPGYHRGRPCVIVLDNYSVHRSAAVKEVLPALAAAGITCFYLPPYSPELNAIEPRPNQCRSSPAQRQEYWAYHGSTFGSPPRWPYLSGRPALQPARRAALGDRAARWQPAIYPRLLVYAAHVVPGEPAWGGNRDDRHILIRPPLLTAQPERVA